MRRRSFLMAAGAASVSLTQRGSAQPSLGTLTWVQHDGLWIRELPDGQAMRLLSGNGFHHPRFSPGGEVIWYKREEDQQGAVRRDGHPATIPDHTERVVSPDRKQFAAVELHEYPADQYGLNRDKTELFVGSVAEPGRKLRTLISQNEGDIQVFGWTRDGKSLVYWRADEWSASAWCDGVELYTIPAAGGAERKIGITSLVYGDMLSLSPKSNLLAVTRGSYREAWTDKRIAVVDLDTGKIRDLTEGNVSALCPAWSPDGATIAYTAAPDGGHLGGGDPAQANLFHRKLWLVDPSGGTPRPFTNDPRYRDEEPMWSADGSHLLFGRMDYDGHASLWLIERSGGGARQICPVRIQSEMPGDEDSWFGYYGYIDWRR